MITKELQSSMWTVITYASHHRKRELTISDLALAGVDIDDMPALKEEFYRRDWIEYLGGVYMVLSYDPRLFRLIENVEFGTVFEYHWPYRSAELRPAKESLCNMYLPHDGPSETERNTDPSLPQVEGNNIALAKRVKDGNKLNPNGRWVRISWGTIVLTRPNIQLER